MWDKLPVLEHAGAAGGGGRRRARTSTQGATARGDGSSRRVQCGLCALVARAFRRAVCGAPSRRGSGDSYQELTQPLHVHPPPNESTTETPVEHDDHPPIHHIHPETVR